MRKSKIGMTGRVAAIGSVALVGGIGHLGASEAEAAVTLQGNAQFQVSNTTTTSTYNTTPTTPGASSFPYVLSKEYFTNSGAYEILPFFKVNTSAVTIPAGMTIGGSQLGLFFHDSAYGGVTHTDWVDLWSVKDEFNPATVNMTTYDGTNAWTDGFDAGVNGFTRTGPAGSHLAFVYFQGQEPGGTPSNKVMNNVQEYKILEGQGLDDYLNAQIAAGKDSYFQLTNSNGSGLYQRFINTGDGNAVSIGALWANQPYLTVNFVEVPEPTGAVVMLVAGASALAQRRRHSAL